MNSLYCDVSNILLNGSTDKNTTHKYGITYDLIFNSQYLKLGRPLRVLEIGVTLFGEGSVGPLSEIPYIEKYVGIDNKEYFGKIPNEKVSLYTGAEYNAYSFETIEFLKNNENKFDIIIDDGPHTWESQEWFFINYYSLLNDGGILLCEDIFEGNCAKLKSLQKRLDLYVLDLRINSNNNKDEIIALRLRPMHTKKKNAIVIPVYNELLKNKEYKACVNTWEYYCKKYDIELCLLEGKKEFQNKPDHAAMCYDRWLEREFPIDKYNRITFVDADTMIRWDTPDINELFENNNIQIGVVTDQGGLHIAKYHFNQWLEFKPNLYSFVTEYFNAGFVSMKSEHLKKLQANIPSYKNYYYTEKDINSHMNGIGKEGGCKLDGLDQTAINLAIQELFKDEITFLPPIFNKQLSYIYPGENNWIFWENWEKFIEKISTFEFINEAFLFHYGGLLLSKENLAEIYWEKTKNNYK